MADNFIRLGNLDYDEIKSSLKDFMQSQSDLGFDFDGSIAATVLDLLTYNTLYYAFYSNMLINESFLESAQRIESVISLIKPFGYAISHRASASANLNIENNSGSPVTLSPYVSAFTATASSGIDYTFYYTGGADGEETDPQSGEVYNQVTISDGASKLIPVYQGKSAIINLPVSVDYDNQKFEIRDTSLDIRTLRVYVQENGVGLKQYTRIDNTNSSISQQDRVYYLETSNTGYTVYFGAPRSDDGNITGRGVGETEIVYVSYLSSTGSAANGSKSWLSGSSITITNPNVIAKGGFDSPNINTIKFMGPREFASAGRLVTVSDYQKAIVDVGGFNISTVDTKRNVGVYGSPQSAVRTTGTVFFSLYDQINGPFTNASNSTIAGIINDLDDQVMAGLTFEYKVPTEAIITFNLNGSSTVFGENHSTGFNQTIKASEVGTWSTVQAGLSGERHVGIIGDTDAYDQNNMIDLKNKLERTFPDDTAGNTFTVHFLDSAGAAQFAVLDITETPANIVVSSDGSGDIIGTAEMDSGRIVFDETKFFMPYNSGAINLYGITANYHSTLSEIKIKDELLGYPIA